VQISEARGNLCNDFPPDTCPKGTTGPGLSAAGLARPLCRILKYLRTLSLNTVARIVLWVFVAILATTACAEGAADLPHDVYVWQRAWTPHVQQSLEEHGRTFAEVVLLKTEVTWKGTEAHTVQIPINYQTLDKFSAPIGLALRIGPYSGSFAETNASARFLTDLAKKLVLDAQTAGIAPKELQLDFDCAASRLQGYVNWVEAIRKAVRPIPLVITALPAWLDRHEFLALAKAADGYVLQVHSLERPKTFEAPFKLCDASAALSAVAKASKLGVPFRVALPTYGYLLAFDSRGGFLGLSAEGPEKHWPVGSRIKEVRSDPLEMAELVRQWSAAPVPFLKGIIWYRLPVSSDILNWRWPTLDAIVHSRIPRKSVRVKTHRVEAGLTEISLVNDGELDISSRLAVQTRWRGARLLAGDGLRGFELTDREVSSARFETGMQPRRLAAGDEQIIGWLRLSEEREVEFELEEISER
jgi:hypothetical protein